MCIRDRYVLGSTINYSVLVTNTGDLALTGVNVSDPLLTNLDCDAGTAGNQTSGLSIPRCATLRTRATPGEVNRSISSSP